MAFGLEKRWFYRTSGAGAIPLENSQSPGSKNWLLKTKSSTSLVIGFSEPACCPFGSRPA
jgi:hypothetical protein